MDKFSEIYGKIKASKALKATKKAFTSLAIVGIAGACMPSCAPTNTTTIRVTYRNGCPVFVQQTVKTKSDPSREFRNNMNSVRTGVNALNSFMKTIDGLGRR